MECRALTPSNGQIHNVSCGMLILPPIDQSSLKSYARDMREFGTCSVARVAYGADQAMFCVNAFYS